MANAERYRWGKLDLVSVPVDSDQAIGKGDMLKVTAGKGVPVSAATDNLGLRYIAMEAHAAGTAGSVDYITCALVKYGPVFEYALNTSTAVTIGDTFQISGAQELTKSATDPVAIAVETKTAAVIRVTFKTPYAAAVGDIS